MPTFTISARCSAQPSSTDPDQHITYVSFDVLTIHYTLQSVKFCKQLQFRSYSLFNNLRSRQYDTNDEPHNKRTEHRDNFDFHYCTNSLFLKAKPDLPLLL